MNKAQTQERNEIVIELKAINRRLERLSEEVTIDRESNEISKAIVHIANATAILIPIPL